MRIRSMRSVCAIRSRMRSILKLILLIIVVAVSIILWTLLTELELETFEDDKYDAETFNTHVQSTVNISTFLVKPYLTLMQSRSLPDLTKIPWLKTATSYRIVGSLMSDNRTREPKPDPFKPTLSPGQRLLCTQLMNTFSQIMFNNGLGDRFFLTAGALLGSFRHHDLIPWDDDVDMLMDVTAMDRVQELMKSLSHLYLYEVIDNRAKFSTKPMDKSLETLDLPLTRNIHGQGYGWPYLDFGFYEQDDKQLWEVALYKRQRLIWPRDIIFPLLFRPVGAHWYPTPRKTLQFLETVSSVRERCVVGYNHIFELMSRTIRIKCHKLGRRYAFVERMLSNIPLSLDGTRGYNLSDMVVMEESLKLKQYDGSETLVHKLYLPSPLSDSKVPMYY